MVSLNAMRQNKTRLPCSDRVVVEWDVDEMGSLDAALSSIMEDPGGAAYFGGWMEKLNGLIHYAEGEFWDVR